MSIDRHLQKLKYTSWPGTALFSADSTLDVINALRLLGEHLLFEHQHCVRAMTPNKYEGFHIAISIVHHQLASAEASSSNWQRAIAEATKKLKVNRLFGLDRDTERVALDTAEVAVDFADVMKLVCEFYEIEIHASGLEGAGTMAFGVASEQLKYKSVVISQALEKFINAWSYKVAHCLSKGSSEASTVNLDFAAKRLELLGEALTYFRSLVA